MRRLAAVTTVVIATCTGVASPAGAGPLTSGWQVSVTEPVPETGLASVSCVSDRYCLAPATGSQGELWNGTAWTATPAAPTAVDVSCTAVRDCMVAGGSSVNPGDPRDGWNTPMLAHWDGSTYTALPLPIDPSVQGYASTVSCPASNSCMAAAGSIVLRWDGATWTRVTTPATPAGDVWVHDVTCTSGRHCIAVGADPAGNAATMLWDGTTWSAVQAPPFVPLQVACDGTNWCMAVGSTAYYPYSVGGGDFGAMDSAAVWDGATWTPVDFPDATWSYNPDVLSCGSRGSCAFVTGDQRENWDGRAWTVAAAPSVRGEVLLYGVDCPDATTCFAVGRVTLPDYSVWPYAERWNASSLTG